MFSKDINALQTFKFNALQLRDMTDMQSCNSAEIQFTHLASINNHSILHQMHLITTPFKGTINKLNEIPTKTKFTRKDHK